MLHSITTYHRMKICSLNNWVLILAACVQDTCQHRGLTYGIILCDRLFLLTYSTIRVNSLYLYFENFQRSHIELILCVESLWCHMWTSSKKTYMKTCGLSLSISHPPPPPSLPRLSPLPITEVCEIGKIIGSTTRTGIGIF